MGLGQPSRMVLSNIRESLSNQNREILVGLLNHAETSDVFFRAGTVVLALGVQPPDAPLGLAPAWRHVPWRGP